MARGTSLIVAFFVLLFAATASVASDRIVERSILNDPDGVFSISDVVEQTFDPAGRIVSRGYTPAVTWVRIVVRSKADDGDLVLRIRPTYLDEVRLYSQSADNEWREIVTGDRVPFSERPLAAVHLGFHLAPTPAADTVYYLRLETTSTSLLSVEALTPADAEVAALATDLFQVLNFVILGWIILWAANEYQARRERVLALFLVCEIMFLIYDLAILGYIAPFIPASFVISADRLTSVLVCATPLVALAFHRELVTPFAPNVIALRAWDALMLLVAIALLMVLVGRVQGGVQLNAFATLLAAPVFVALAFSARKEGLPGRNVLRLTYAAQAASLVISMVPILGLVEAIDWNLHATLIHGLISAGLMFFVLNRRSHQLREQGFQATVDLIFARQQLELERQQRDIQERFVAMLTHELKTPLSVVRLASGMAGTEGEPKRLIDNALGEMTALVDRCAYAARLDQERLEVQRTACDIGDAIAAAGAGSDARLRIDVGKVPKVVCDPPLLGVMLTNLIDNAMKYSADGTPVDVVAEPVARQGRDGVSIVVDSVPGRAGRPDPARVFEKFYRAPGAHRKVGSGLGLYIVRGLAELTGGSVVYEPIDGKVRFRLWLPC